MRSVCRVHASCVYSACTVRAACVQSACAVHAWCMQLHAQCAHSARTLCAHSAHSARTLHVILACLALALGSTALQLCCVLVCRKTAEKELCRLRRPSIVRGKQVFE